MNTVAAMALALALLAFQLASPADRAEHASTCAAAGPVAATAPPDFLFASAQEWKRYALEAELDAPR